MNVGAVALIDALGWKGIWNRDPNLDVIASIRSLRVGAEAAVEKTNKRLDGPLLYESPWPARAETAVRFLSDTIVVAAWVQPPNSPEDVVIQGEQGEDTQRVEVAVAMFTDVLLNLTCQMVANIVKSAAFSPKPIAYRGAIASGRFLVEDNLIVGPAVDAAAEAMDVPDAAAIWLPPGTVDEGASRISTLMYELPLKEHGPLNVRVLNPFVTCHDGELDQLEARMMVPFDNATDLRVIKKKQATGRFLTAAKAAWVPVSNAQGTEDTQGLVSK